MHDRYSYCYSEFWDNVFLKRRDSKEDLDWGFDWLRPRIDFLTTKRVKKILDVGCGTGADLELYHRAGCHIHGVDLSPAMLEVARRKFSESAEFHLCDAAGMPFEDGYFDLVLSTYTLHEMDHHQVSIPYRCN